MPLPLSGEHASWILGGFPGAPSPAWKLPGNPALIQPDSWAWPLALEPRASVRVCFCGQGWSPRAPGLPHGLSLREALNSLARLPRGQGWLSWLLAAGLSCRLALRRTPAEEQPSQTSRSSRLTARTLASALFSSCCSGFLGVGVGDRAAARRLWQGSALGKGWRGGVEEVLLNGM